MSNTQKQIADALGLTGKGINNKTRSPVEAGKCYYLGASSSPDLIRVTRVTPDRFWYRNGPDDESTREIGIETWIGLDLIARAEETMRQRLHQLEQRRDHLADSHARYLRHILETGAPPPSVDTNDNQVSVIKALPVACPPTMTVRLGGQRYNSVHEGPGRRTVLWLAGCSVRCPACINPQLFAADSGQAVSLEAADALLAQGLNTGDQGVTFVGGEPFDQALALAALCRTVVASWPTLLPIPRLIVYSGYTFEQLRARQDHNVEQVLRLADVLIDGPFVAALADEALLYRGSRNQRVINLRATLAAGEVVIIADWDRPRLSLLNGAIVTSPPVARLLGLSDLSDRQCGQW